MAAALPWALARPAPGAQAPGVVHIGFTGPLTGGAATYAEDVRRGIALAVREIDAAGGVHVHGRSFSLDLVAFDDRYLPNESAANAARLVRADRTPIVFCPYPGGIYALLAMNERAPRFIVAAYVNDPAILRLRDRSVVMIPPRFDAYFAPWAAAAMRRFGKRLEFMPATTDYANAWKNGFGAAWTAAGGTIVGDDSADYHGTADFTDDVRKALTTKPDVMLVGGPPEATAHVIDTARRRGYAGGFVMIDQATFDDVEDFLPRARLNGTLGVAPLERLGGPGLQPFRAAYAKAYGRTRPPDVDAALNYVATHAFARAMQLAGSTSDTRAILAQFGAALVSLPPRERVVVPRGFTRTGHIELDLPSDVVVHGRYEPVPIPPVPSP